jgi:hypothetical protein
MGKVEDSTVVAKYEPPGLERVAVGLRNPHVPGSGAHMSDNAVALCRGADLTEVYVVPSRLRVLEHCCELHVVPVGLLVAKRRPVPAVT